MTRLLPIKKREANNSNNQISSLFFFKMVYDFLLTVADLGFPRGGGANSPGGRQHTILPKFPKNCMKLKEFGPRGGGPRVQNFFM